jgi:NADH dehydrogenase
VARLCVEAAAGEGNGTVDAVGPETFTFRDWVALVRDAIGARSWLVQVPAPLVSPLTGVIGRVLGDVLLTRDELEGLMAGLVTTDGPATGRIVFSDWLAEHASEVGRSYASEVRRHFDR